MSIVHREEFPNTDVSSVSTSSVRKEELWVVSCGFYTKRYSSAMVPTNNIAPSFDINHTQPTIPLFALMKGRCSNVSFRNFNGGQFTLSTQLIKPNYHALYYHNKSLSTLFLYLLFRFLACLHLYELWYGTVFVTHWKRKKYRVCRPQASVSLLTEAFHYPVLEHS